MNSIIYRDLTKNNWEDDEKAWEKQTLNFILGNKEYVISEIKKIVNWKRYYNVNVEEIYLDLINYLYKSDDYNVGYERNGKEITLIDYIKISIIICLKKYVGKKQEEKNMNRITISMDNEGELGYTLHDYLRDNTDVLEEVLINLEIEEERINGLIAEIKKDRFIYGVDILKFIYIIALTVTDVETRNIIFEEFLDLREEIDKIIDYILKDYNCKQLLIKSLESTNNIDGEKIVIKMIRENISRADEIDKLLITKICV